ncbi:hypothetical protein RO3G_10717 [Rhizopus delemar RA 99-880]|uniref:RNase H type-1 domain-containing protein n=1 Tax=Rhizopus delemar (strain RA 99-880 / ATCC MYA-4621 / FGSC 9543 / NRRL 43880) TaxID=246409 RepID=I1CC27_RHIO9|nr:hypothetical protein RO3G_10717 [Rhizopus delemar RA 99-880]|eukprot:EIE86007.1 hypothetical protein RO3G_10717 [Rhizopus delemar RA 99-880]
MRYNKAYFTQPVIAQLTVKDKITKHWDSFGSHCTLYVDASNSGWGCAYLTQRAHGYWTNQEAQMSINWRELKAAFLALQAFPHLTNTTVLIRTDNTTSLAYINKQGGTKSFSLMTLATTLWKWCLQRGLMLVSSHVSDIHNCKADYESRRSFTKNLWQVKPEVFNSLLQSQWGPHGVDMFADRTSNLLEKKNSERGSPSNHNGSSLLAVSNLVPSATTSGDSPSSFPVPHRHTNHHNTDTMATTASVEALRLAALGASSSTPVL